MRMTYSPFQDRSATREIGVDAATTAIGQYFVMLSSKSGGARLLR